MGIRQIGTRKFEIATADNVIESHPGTGPSGFRNGMSEVQSRVPGIGLFHTHVVKFLLQFHAAAF